MTATFREVGTLEFKNQFLRANLLHRILSIKHSSLYSCWGQVSRWVRSWLAISGPQFRRFLFASMRMNYVRPFHLGVSCGAPITRMKLSVGPELCVGTRRITRTTSLTTQVEIGQNRLKISRFMYVKITTVYGEQDSPAHIRRNASWTDPLLTQFLSHLDHVGSQKG